MPNIRHEVLIGASAQSVYKVITSQEGLSGWWTPETIAKPEVGSISRFSFGSDYFKSMEITELVPNELVKWDCTHGAEEWVGTHISFRLVPGDKAYLLHEHAEATGQIQQQQDENGGTLLAFAHDDWRDYTPMFAECNYTWAQFLRSLKLLCETGKGRPWPLQHGVS